MINIEFIRLNKPVERVQFASKEAFLDWYNKKTDWDPNIVEIRFPQPGTLSWVGGQQKLVSVQATKPKSKRKLLVGIAAIAVIGIGWLLFGQNIGTTTTLQAQNTTSRTDIIRIPMPGGY
jgi:hypothetical protein